MALGGGCYSVQSGCYVEASWLLTGYKGDSFKLGAEVLLGGCFGAFTHTDTK